MADEAGDECALWYMRHGVAYVELCPTEMHAVRRAIDMQEYETGAPDGVQFPDGTYYDADSWPAFKAEKRRLHEELVRSVFDAPPRQRPVTLDIVSPAGRVAQVEGDDFRPWMRRR